MAEMLIEFPRKNPRAPRASETTGWRVRRLSYQASFSPVLLRIVLIVDAGRLLDRVSHTAPPAEISAQNKPRRGEKGAN